MKFRSRLLLTLALSVAGSAAVSALPADSVPAAGGFELERQESDSVACALATIWSDYTKKKAQKDGQAITEQYMLGLKDAIEKAKADDAYYMGLEQGVAINDHLRRVEDLGGFTIDRTKFLYELDMLTTGKRRYKTGFTQKSAEEYMNRLLTRISEERYRVEHAAQFLAETAQREGIEKTPSGLLFEVIQEGEGEMPTEGDIVLVNYTGSFLDGEVFNATQPGEPTVFEVSGTIPGFREGLKKMKKGGRYRLYMDSDLGYGDRGVMGVIPGGAAVVFDVELVDFRHLQPATPENNE